MLCRFAAEHRAEGARPAAFLGWRSSCFRMLLMRRCTVRRKSGSRSGPVSRIGIALAIATLASSCVGSHDDAKRTPFERDASADGASEHERERVFFFGGASRLDLVQCGADDSCPEGQSCYRLARELGICDAKQVEATECALGPSVTGDDARATSNQCACDGLSCDEGQICRRMVETCSCGINWANKCVDKACAQPSDCSDGTVCRPSSLIVSTRCLAPECQSDADCDRGLQGRCSAILFAPLQSGEFHLESVSCVYARRPGDPDDSEDSGVRLRLGSDYYVR